MHDLVGLHESHYRQSIRPARGWRDLSGAGSHFIPFDLIVISGMTLTRLVVGGQQISALFGCLVIIKILIMRKRLRRAEDMDGSRHVRVNQTNELEVSRCWKNNCIGLSWAQWAGIHAVGAIEAGIIWSGSWTAHRKRRARLAGYQKSHRMQFV